VPESGALFPNRGKTVTLREQRSQRKDPTLDGQPTGQKMSRVRSGASAVGSIDTLGLMGGESVQANALDVGRIRESTRRRRLWHLFFWLAPIAVFFYYRIGSSNPIRPGMPELSQTQLSIVLPLGLMVILGIVLVVPMVAMGKSPHVRYDPSEIETTLDDVVGLGPVKDEVVKSLNLFLGYQTFRKVMGGNPRKGVLFEGPPGTGKTYMAKAMAREAGVPFLFVSSTAFQNQFYGATGRKIRNYFKELRKAAREEGGAIGFIEEIDAIAGARSGMRMTPAGDIAATDPWGRTTAPSGTSEGISGVVNELLIQLQSFDAPGSGHSFKSWWIDRANRFLPAHRRIKKRAPEASNILIIAATNRAADLDPALLRPGRFDRSIHFDIPGRSGRREIIDYYLGKKAHVPELDKEERRDQLAAMTFGYTPVMIEHLFDEGLVWALRNGKSSMDWSDVQQAKLTEEIGLKQPVEYTEDEKRTIATHEAGHATVAYLVGQNRKLEVLSIIKRRDALGLLAHTDTEERFTRTRSELIGMMKIAFGGMSAEELFFGESGTGPSGDLVHATKIAAQMVGSFGMAGSLVSYEAVEAGPLTQGIVSKVLGNEDARTAVEKLLEQAKADVHRLLDDHRHLVVALRDELLAKEELVGEEIVDVLREAEARHRITPSGV
jgi:ATP-dependent Zn protease